MMNGLFSEEMRRDPYPFYAQMSQQGPLISDPRGQIWMLMDYASVKLVLSDHETFSSDVTPPQSKLLDWLVYTDPPEQTRLRKLFTRALMPRSLTDWEPRIHRIAHELLNSNIERGDMDLVAAYSAPLPARVIAEVIGVPAAEQTQFLALNSVLQDFSARLVSHQINQVQLRQYERLQKQLYAYLQQLMVYKQKMPGDDLLTRLLQVQSEAEALSEAEIIGFIQMLYSGATETTTNLIGNAVIALLEHPQQLALLSAQPELIDSSIEEILRFRSPIQTLIRKVRQPVSLHGQTIPVGSYLFAVLGAANRDPSVFEQANVFNIRRDPNPHLSFGYGAHYCMGMQFARLEARIAIATLLTRLKELQLSDSRPWVPQKVQYMLGPAHLAVSFKPAPRRDLT